MLAKSSPSPPPVALNVASLPSLHATFTCEHAILEQLLYKNKNQHRKANYYQKLMAVARSNRHIHFTQSSLSSINALRNTADSLRSSLVAILQAAEPLYALLRQTYFMPFALTSLAVLARLLMVIKATLLVILVEMKEREERGEERVRLFSARSVGTALLRALRDRRVEDVVVDMAGFELDELWAPSIEAVAHAPSHAETTARRTVEKEVDPWPPRFDKGWQSMRTAVAIMDEDDHGDSVLQSPTVTLVPATSSYSSSPSAIPSASKQPSFIRTTLPVITQPRPEPRLTIPPTLPVSHSDPVITEPAATAAAPVAAGNKKRKLTALNKVATASSPAAQLPLRGLWSLQVSEAQRTAGGVKVAKDAAVRRGKPSALVDDIDEIFGF